MNYQDQVNWAVRQWEEQVMYRPLANIHRRSLDDVWRQVIRHFGGNPDELIGPDHDSLMSDHLEKELAKMQKGK